MFRKTFAGAYLVEVSLFVYFVVYEPIPYQPVEYLFFQNTIN